MIMIAVRFPVWLFATLVLLALDYLRWTVLSLLWAWRLVKHHEWPDHRGGWRSRYSGRFVRHPMIPIERFLRKGD
jgi:hypothetical protein